MVFMSHYFPATILASGWVGVDFFFVLSGFLITGILWDSRFQAHRVRDFYIRRVLRIFPLYYAIWLALAISTPLFGWDWNWRWSLFPLHLGNYLPYLFFVPDNPARFDTLRGTAILFGTHPAFVPVVHLWSLCVEEQFYLIWPAIVFLSRERGNLLRVAIAAIIAVPILRMLLYSRSPAPLLQMEMLYRLTPTRVDSFMYGALLALLLRGPERDWLARNRRWICSTVYGSCVFLYILFRKSNHGWYLAKSSMAVSTVGFSVIDLLAAAILLDAIHPNSTIYRLLNRYWLRWIGGISYGVYVYQSLFLNVYISLARRLPVPWHSFTVTLAAVALPSTLLLSYLSFRFYELPLLSLKKRFSHQVHGAPTA